VVAIAQTGYVVFLDFPRGEDPMPGRRIDRSGRRRGRKRELVAVVAAGVLALVVGWSVNTILANGGESPSESDDSPSSSPTPQSTDSSLGDGTSSGQLLRACSSEVSKAERAFSAARAGVHHWSVHVQARTDMLNGRMSEKKMNAVWTRTRTAGPADLRRFRAALQHYDGTVPCDDLQDVPQSRKDAVIGCVARSKTASETVTAAEVVMDDWNSHLQHMATYADGGMTSGRAQRLWVKAWRTAPANISAYRDGHTALANAPAC